MRSFGATVSGVGHTGLVLWLVLGWGLDSEPLPFDVSDVSVVSGEEYAALVRATSPDPGLREPELATPVIDQAPVTPAPEDIAEPAPTPDASEPPEDELAPPEAPEPPAPVADIEDDIPELTSPDLVEQPEISEDIVTETPNAAPAPVISPSQIPQPVSDAPVAIDTTPAERPDPVDDQAEVEDPQEATSAEETAQTTSVENTQVSGAPARSLRPASRPNRPTVQPQPEVEVSETEDTISDVLADVVGSEPAVEEGPPMTGAEKDAFRLAVNSCWVVDTGAASANVTVEVGFSLGRDGKVQSGPDLLSATGGDGSAQRAAFEAARRAILRCQRNGYELPADKYGQWQNVVITFDPRGMRLR